MCLEEEQTMFGSMVKSMKDYIGITLKYAPLFIGIVFTVFGLVAANYSYLMVAIGMFIGVPALMYILELVIGLINRVGSKSWSLYVEEAASASADLGFLKGNPVAGAPYMWYPMMTFILSYLFINAVDLYSAYEDKPAVKGKASIGMLISAVSFVVLMYSYSVFSKFSENVYGRIVIFIFTVAFAYGWHKFLKGCSSQEKNIHLDDLYGVKTNIVKVDALATKKVCVAAPSMEGA
jgi:hypothetical protein